MLASALAPNSMRQRLVGVLDVTTAGIIFEFSHVDVTGYHSNPLESTNANNMNTHLWGAGKFAELFQHYQLTNFEYKYIPSVAYTWSGTTAIKYVNDPLDNSNGTTVNNFINAPSSFMTPIYLPAASGTVLTRQEKKFCFSSMMSVDPNQTGTDPYSEIIRLTQRRHQSYGYLHISTFGVTDPTGAAPSQSTIVGRVLLTLDVIYSSPIPLGQNTNTNVPIRLPFVASTTTPPPFADEATTAEKQSLPENPLLSEAHINHAYQATDT